MVDKDLNFLLHYAKMGVLEEIRKKDPIEAEEIKQKYIQIKQRLKKPSDEVEKTSSDKVAKTGSAVKDWFKGIGDRQRKYKENHPEQRW